MFPRMYCYYCAATLLNAASRILYYHVTPDGQRNEDTWFHERGYQAIELLGEEKLKEEKAGNKLIVEMNQQVVRNGIFATCICNGYSVCTAHIYDAVELERMRPRHGR